MGVVLRAWGLPPYVRRSARVAAALPWLYLKGVSSGDLGEVRCWSGKEPRASAGRAGAAEGPVERGLPGLGAAGFDGEALRLGTRNGKAQLVCS
jgi:hypothetical protein